MRERYVYYPFLWRTDIVYTKWAPERIIELVTQELVWEKVIDIGRGEEKELYTIYAKLAWEWKRVLGMSYREIENKEKYVLEEVEKSPYLSVLQRWWILRDQRSLQRFTRVRKLGIRVIMITGDSELTAASVGKMIGLTGYSRCYHTRKYDWRRAHWKNKNYQFFRIAPQDKLRIVAYSDHKDILSRWPVMASMMHLHWSNLI